VFKARRYPKFVGRDRFEFCYPRRQSSLKVHIILSAPRPRKSLVPKCSEITRNSPHISKGVFENDICEFESSRPSQPVLSLWAMSGLQKYVRHSRELARRHVVSDA
jgi:hypothetical protein